MSVWAVWGLGRQGWRPGQPVVLFSSYSLLVQGGKGPNKASRVEQVHSHGHTPTHPHTHWGVCVCVCVSADQVAERPS